jgi:hypothetical protein
VFSFSFGEISRGDEKKVAWRSVYKKKAAYEVYTRGSFSVEKMNKIRHILRKIHLRQ